MSDSEDENVFESADEGEESQKANVVKGKKKASATNKAAHAQVDSVVKEKTDSPPTTSYKQTSKGKNKSLEKKSQENREKATPQKARKPVNTDTDNQVKRDESTKNDNRSENKDNISPVKGSAAGKDSLHSEMRKMDIVEKVNDGTCGKEMPQTESWGVSSDQSDAAPAGNFQWGSMLGKLSTAAEKAQTSSWGSWGSSFLSAATNSVQTFTSQVGEGFNAVMETVEDSLGAIDPIELAKIEQENAAEKEIHYQEESGQTEDKISAEMQVMTREGGDIDASGQAQSADVVPATSDGWMNSWKIANIISDFQGATKTIVNEGLDLSKGLVVGTVGAGKTLMTGGLDVLETIGKTTYDVLAEGDHGLKQTIRKNKINLSQILREAKETAEMKAKEETEDSPAEVNYSVLFDQYQGLVHLEALEMLSNQCETKVHMIYSSLSADTQPQAQQQNDEIKKAFHLELDSEDEEVKDHDFEGLVTKILSELNIGAHSEKLIQVHTKNRDFLAAYNQDLEKGETVIIKEIYQHAVQSLADLTAKSTEMFHKTAELILSRKYEKKYSDMASSLESLTKLLCSELEILSTRYIQCFNKAAENCDDPSSVNGFITNVYLEASNSSTYVQDAFQLVLPVIQQAALERLT